MIRRLLAALASLVAPAAAQAAQLPATVPAGNWQLRLAAGVGPSESAAVELGLSVGLTDRLQLGLLAPGIAYRFGEATEAELVLRAQVPGWPGAAFEDSLLGASRFTWLQPKLGAELRTQVAASLGLLLLGEGSAILRWRGGQMGSSWGFNGAGGLLWQLGEAVTFAPGLSYGEANYGHDADAMFPITLASFGCGSVLTLGGHPVPLLRWAAWDQVSLDAYASATWTPDLPEELAYDALAGGTWVF